MRKEIPARVEITCDLCGHKVENDNHFSLSKDVCFDCAIEIVEKHLSDKVKNYSCYKCDPCQQGDKCTCPPSPPKSQCKECRGSGKIPSGIPYIRAEPCTACENRVKIAEKVMKQGDKIIKDACEYYEH